MINSKLYFALLTMTSCFCCSKGKVHPVTGNEGTEGSTGIIIFFLYP